MIASRHQGMVMVALVAACVTFAGCSQMSARTERSARRVPKYDAKTFFETTTVFGASFSHDEKRLLITSDASGVFNAYAQPIAGGKSKRLTHSTTDSIFGVSYFPKDDRILYTADQGGNELNHLFVLEADGTARDLTPGEDLKASFEGWSKDRTQFWVTTNERNPKHFDLYRYYTDGYQREMVFENTEAWQVADVSPNGRWVALGKVRNNADSDIYVWDANDPGAKPKHITTHEGNVNHQAMTFTPDSKTLYYRTDGHGEFFEAWSYELASGKHEPALKADWDIMYVRFSENGRYIVAARNEDARTVISVRDRLTGSAVNLPELPNGDIKGVSFARSERTMAFYINGDTSPSNLYTLDIRSGTHRRLTDTLNPAIRREHLVEGEVIRYKSFDGLEIPAVLYRPHSATRSNRAAALVWVHGGPGGQSRHGYRAAMQHLINHGYALLAVNNRGSSGYGKTFFHLDDRRHGEDDLQDCIWGRRYLESLDWVDGNRIGIIGGSYGGFMVAAALTFTPEAFDVGIDIFGVTNWVRTLESIPPYWESFREYLYAELGDPATDKERLRRISPLFHASNIVRPLLVVQGANDPRVLKAESDELVEAARKNGIPVEYIVFDDEGHGFRKKKNRIAASNAYVRFLDKHLTGARRGG